MAIIARGDIIVNLDDRGAKRELKQLEQAVKQSFHDMNRQRAVPRVTLEHDDYDRAYKIVKAQIEDLKKQRAKAVVRMDVDGVTKAQAEIRLLEQQLKQFDRRRYETQVRVNVERDSQRALDALSEGLRKLTSGKFYTNIGVNVDEGDLRRVESELESRINNIERRKAKLIIEGDATGVAAAIAEIKTLDAVLGDVRGRIREFERQRLSVPIDIRPELSDRDLRLMKQQLSAEARDLERERIRLRIEGDVEGFNRIQERIDAVTVSMHRLTARRWQLRNPFRDVERDGSRTLNLLDRLHNTVREGQRWWNEFGGSILGAGIRLGPLTLRLRAAVAVMTYLAPLLVSLGGAFVAAGGALYSGLLGTLGPTVAGLSALGVGIGGIIAVAAPLVQDMGAASKATEKYNKAVRESGRDSTRAKNALEQMRNVMGDVGPEVARSFRDFNRLGAVWRRLTRDARPAFFETFADGVNTARSLMPLFARESTKTFQLAARGVREWFAGLRGDEARNIFRRIFQGAQESIPNLQAAIGNLGTFLGRVAKAAMPLWEEFTRTLERWTGGWADAAKDQSGVQAFLERTKDSLVDVGQLIGATARLLHNLFMGGDRAGRGFLDTITALFNRWADFLGTARGQREVHEFFQDAINMAETFFGIMGNMGRIFFGIAQNLAPIAKLVGDIVRLLTAIPRLDLVLTGAIGGIVLIRTLSKAAAIIASMKAAVLAMQAGGGIAGALAAGNIARMQALGKLPMAATTVATEAAGAAAGGAVGARGSRGTRGAVSLADEAGAAAVGHAMGEAATKAGALARGVALVRTGFTALTGPLGIAVAGLTVGGVALTKLTNQGGSTFDRLNKLRDTMGGLAQAAKTSAGANRELTNAGLQYRSAALTVQQAEREVNRLRRDGKQGTFEYKNAMVQLEQAYANQAATEQNLGRLIRTGTAAAHQRVAGWRAMKREAIANGASSETLLRIENGLQKAINAEIAVNINAARSRRGLAAITGEAGIKMGFLVKQFQKLPRGDVVRKFFVQADTRQAQAAIRNIGRLQDAGVSDRTVIRILASTGDAETKLAKLRALASNIDKLSPNVTVGAKDNASPKIRNVRQLGNSIVRSFVLSLGARGDGTAKGKIGTVRALAQSIVRTFTATLNARDQGSAVISGFLGLLSSIPRVVTTLLTTRRSGGGGRGRGGSGGATGGERPETARRTKGEVVRDSTFLAGEERRPEIVIATNPRYRRRNLGLLRYAARALGVPRVGEEIKNTLESPLMQDSWLEIPRFAEGGVTKKERAQMKKRKRVFKKRVNLKKRQIRRLNRRWQPEVRAEQSKVKKIEDEIQDRVQKRDQDDQQFQIDLDNNPIVVQDAEGNDVINEGARQERLSKLTNLQEQTQRIINRYNDLKNALTNAVKKINDVIERFENRRKGITTRRYGSKGAKDLRKQIDEKISNLKEDRASANERLHVIGDERERGEQRGERLTWNQYDAEKRQTRQQSIRQGGVGAGGDQAQSDAIAEQAKAQATFFQRQAEVSEAALRAFAGPGDISYGRASRAFDAVVGGAQAARQAFSAPAQAAAAAQAAFGTLPPLSGPPPTDGGAAGGGGPTVIVQTLHPGDPQTLDAIGKAATGGISLQGASISPRVATGL